MSRYSIDLDFATIQKMSVVHKAIYVISAKLKSGPYLALWHQF